MVTANSSVIQQSRLTDLWREVVQMDLDRAVLDRLSCGCPEDHFAGEHWPSDKVLDHLKADLGSVGSRKARRHIAIVS